MAMERLIPPELRLDQLRDELLELNEALKTGGQNVALIREINLAKQERERVFALLVAKWLTS